MNRVPLTLVNGSDAPSNLLTLLGTDGTPIDSAVAGDVALTRLPDGGYILYSNWSDGTIVSFRPVAP